MKNILYRYIISMPVWGYLLIAAQPASAQDMNRLKAHFGDAIAPGSSPRHLKLREAGAMDRDAVLEAYQKASGFRSVDALRPERQEGDASDVIRYVSRQYYRDIPVEGAEISVYERQGKVYLARGALIPNLSVPATPALTEPEALQQALLYTGIQRFAWQDSASEAYLKDYRKDLSATFYPVGALTIASKAGIGDTATANYALCWKFDIYEATMSEGFTVYVDATTGQFVNKIPLTHNSCVDGTGITTWYGTKTIHTNKPSGSATYLLDADCPGTNNVRIHTVSAPPAGAITEFRDTNNVWDEAAHRSAVTSHWGTEVAVDYFKKVHARNSFDNAGGDINVQNNVRFNFSTGPSNNNATFNHSLGLMRIGPGNTASPNDDWNPLDIVVHELAHGVTGTSAKLVYQGESGALNESFSDVFAAAAEYWTMSGDWLIGEDMTRGAIRNMSNPGAFGDPDTYLGANWKPTAAGAADFGGVHSNSGVQNYWFNLLSVGGSGVNDNNDKFYVEGIGTSKAARIAYRNLTMYLGAGSNYNDARTGAIQAATDLFGECSNEVIQTTNAWYAAGVGPSSLMVDSTHITKAACNQNNGDAYVRVKGLVGNAVYAWSNGQATQTAVNLAKGTFKVTITDNANNCKVDTTLKVEENVNFTWSFNRQNVTNCGGNDGSLEVVLTGVNGTPTIQWSTGSNTPKITNLAKGMFGVMVTDTSTQCKRDTTLEITEPTITTYIAGGGTRTFCIGEPASSITLSAQATNCRGCMYSWSGGQVVQNITVNTAGSYSVTVMDSLGCKGMASTELKLFTRYCGDCILNVILKFFGFDLCQEWEIQRVASRDPNDMIGPPGYGDPRWVSVKDNLPYIIRFENDPDFATAPAQRVEIEHVLDDNLNLFSLRLGDFGFGNRQFEVPANATYYNTRLDVRDSLNIFVDVSAGIDVANNRAFWIFQSVDPLTGLAPSDPQAGLLPVNDSLSRRGEGFVSFTVRPKAASMTGDSILAEAAIIFDDNETIHTPRIFNLIDALPPASTMTGSPPAVTDSSSFTLHWTGQDDAGGCGVRDYALYVSANNGSFTPYQTGIPDTFVVFQGQPGSTYSFFTLATDNVGNTEPLKTLGQQTVTVNSARNLDIFALNRDSFCAGDSVRVLWTMSGLQAVDVYFSPDGGNTLQLLAADWKADTSYFGWRIAHNYAGCATCAFIVADTAAGSPARDTIFTSIHTVPDIADPPAVTNATCPGDMDGMIVLAVSGGTPPYQYLWSDNQTTAAAAALGVGTYTATVTDAKGCTDTASATVDAGSGDDLFAQAEIQVFLQGPYVSAAALMHDSLRVKGLIPLTEPYTGLTNFTHTGGGGEQTTPAVLSVTGPNAIVDWVFLELRSASNPALVLATRSALVQRDGDVVDVDGASPVLFGAAAGPDYYLTVRHRNHLGVQLGEATEYAVCDVLATNFTALPAQGFYSFNGLNDAQKTVSGTFVLWAGNGRIDYQLKYNGSNNDRTAILAVVGLATPNAIVPGYLPADYNLDGVVKYNGAANDRNVLLGNVGIATPSAIVHDQVAR